MGANQSGGCCAARRRSTRTAPPDSRRRSILPKVSIALMGNSIIYYNDTPRLLEAFGGSDLFDQGIVEQDSCLRGGVGLSQLLAKGNGMEAKFGADDHGSPDVASLLARPWDYVVINDYTQACAWRVHGGCMTCACGVRMSCLWWVRGTCAWGVCIACAWCAWHVHATFERCTHTQAPARAASRLASIGVLVDQIVPLLRRCGGTPVLLETWAYRAHTKGSDDLGDHAEFTSRLQEGYREYAAALAAALPPEVQPRVAPVGTAFFAVHERRPDMWRELFHTDGVHPSPLGSYLVVRSMVT